MIPTIRVPSALTWAALFLALSISIFASSPPPVPTLQPYQVRAPGGGFLFEVTPSTPNGAGPSTAVLRKRQNGEVVWKQTLPYTFWQACVQDDGTVGGFAYTTGPSGGSIFGGEPGEFLVRILDVQGTAKYAETTSRRPPSFYTPVPYAEGLTFDTENDRMVILMSNQTFRSYDLHSGTLINAVHLNRKSLPDRRGGIDKFQALPRTPFLLVSLPHWTSDDGVDTPGTVFTLMDMRGDLIWVLNHEWTLPEEWEEYAGSKVLSVFPDKPHDPFDDDPFEAEPDPFAEEPNPFGDDDDDDESHKADAQDGAPPPPPKPRPMAEFDLYLDGIEHGQRVTFRVSKVGQDPDAKWKVEETKRIKWTLPSEFEVPKGLPHAETKMLGEFSLLSRANKPLANLIAVALGPDEQIYALQSTTSIVHVYNREGKLLHLCEPPPDAHIPSWGSILAVDARGEVFVRQEDMIQDQDGNYVKNPNAGFLHFSPEGERRNKPFTLHRDAFGQEWYGQPGTNNILVTNGLAKMELVRRDKYFTQVAELTRRPDGNWLDYLSDVAFAPDGSFAVRDYSGSGEDSVFSVIPSHRPASTVSIYDNKGSPVRTLDFTSGPAFSRIAYDGTHLVAAWYDHPFQPFLYVLKADGDPVGLLEIEALRGNQEANPRPFIVNQGTEILLVDQHSARVFRYRMPK